MLELVTIEARARETSSLKSSNSYHKKCILTQRIAQNDSNKRFSLWYHLNGDLPDFISLYAPTHSTIDFISLYAPEEHHGSSKRTEM